MNIYQLTFEVFQVAVMVGITIGCVLGIFYAIFKGRKSAYKTSRYY